MAWKEWRKKSLWGQMDGWMEGWVEELLNNHFPIVGSFCLSFIWNWNMNSYKNTDISISVRNQSVHLTVCAYFINCSNPVFRLIYMWVHLTLSHTQTLYTLYQLNSDVLYSSQTYWLTVTGQWSHLPIACSIQPTLVGASIGTMLADRSV